MNRNTRYFGLLFALSVSSVWATDEKSVYGRYEYVGLVGFSVQVEAKLDTGAYTASMSARDIHKFKRDGQNWVRFYLHFDEDHQYPFETPLIRMSKIKRRADDFNPEDSKSYATRPVVAMSLCMGNRLRTVEVNLTDRSAFRFPLLIGAKALKSFSAVVDPSEQYIAGQPNCSPARSIE